MVVSSKSDILEKLPRKIDLIVFDFDGVFTTNEVIVNEKGEESVICNRSDGLGISMLRTRKIPMMIVSKEGNQVVMHRANKMKLPFANGIQDKKSLVCKLINDKGLNRDNIIYMGNDVNDAECMKVVGVSVAPVDAHPSILELATIVLTRAGGKGAVRELVDYILEKQDSLN